MVETQKPQEILLFNEGEILYALIETTRGIDPSLRKLVELDNTEYVDPRIHTEDTYLYLSAFGPKATQSRLSMNSTYFVPLMLEEDLFLVVRAPDRIELKGCKCSVSFPEGKWTGISLNHAYTQISQRFKPHLRAHTGNAFDKIHYRVTDFPLSEIDSQIADAFDAFNKSLGQVQSGFTPAQSFWAWISSFVPLSEMRKAKVGDYEAMAELRAAITMALNFHGQQKRKGGSIPYISHLLAVAGLVMEHGGTDDEVIAALLHDAVDNQGEAAFSRIKQKFSQAIVDIVSECTDTMESPMPSWRTRKEKFLATLDKTSDSARLVIAADKLHNARCVLSDFRKTGDDVWEKFSGKKDGTLWYYRSITEVLRKTGPHLLAAELARVVTEIEKLAEIPRAGLGVRVDTIQAELNYKQLQGMIGLNELKRVIEKDIGVVLHNQQLREQGHQDPPTVSLHMVFVGNPGTGKTKVARLLGSIYKNLGLLSKGHVYEVSRADLVGTVIGQTEMRTREAVEKSKGGFLFIDEAYALNKSGDDFGNEAIEVVLKAMSDMPRDFGVIVAGYPEGMNKFLESNAGLRSRFRGREIPFPDFTPDQMREIAESAVKKMQMYIDEEALQYLNSKLTDAYRNRDASFGNARYVNSLILEARAALAERIRTLPRKATYEELVTITLSDVQRVFKKKEISSIELSVDEDSLREVLDQLQNLAGIPEVKQEVMELVDLVRFHRSMGKDTSNFLSSHFVFTGNPGTGKTTVARMLARIFQALGLLERGHLVECDRQSLVAGFIGQTALKTEKVIEKAQGGVLFIDEAYSLTPGGSNDFGPEAIEVLLKRMEDQRGKFVVIVAGYPREMEGFLASNPGLKSRFDTFIHFRDYESEELLAIAKSIFAEDKVSPDIEAISTMKAYFEKYVRARNQFSGNARDVRKLVKKSMRNQNLRLSRLTHGNAGTNDEQKWIRREDLSNWEFPKTPERHPMGFAVDTQRD